MARKPTGKPVGCPKKDINWELFEQLCAVQCTQSEIASMLKIAVNTLHDRALEHYGESYCDVNKRFSESGKCSLRRNQYVQSKTKPNMAIFLGKNWLGQTDGREFIAPPADKAIASDLEYIKRIGQLMIEINDLKGKIDGNSSTCFKPRDTAPSDGQEPS